MGINLQQFLPKKMAVSICFEAAILILKLIPLSKNSRKGLTLFQNIELWLTEILRFPRDPLLVSGLVARIDSSGSGRREPGTPGTGPG